ncbi:hypothetical protein RI367_003477 [Sorochytrium milnesiophthora]
MDAISSTHLPLGKHYMLDLYGVPLKNTRFLESTGMVDSVSKFIADAGLTLLDYSAHHFDCGGITAVFLLSESHVSMHTWPEHGFVALDVYTCGSGRPETIVEEFKALLKPTQVRQTFVERGIRHVVQDQSSGAAVTAAAAATAAPEPRSYLPPPSASGNNTMPVIPYVFAPDVEDDANGALLSFATTNTLEKTICVNGDDDDDDCFLLRNAEVLADERSAYQRIEVVDTQSWGRCMLLDRVVQFCMLDNGVYTREMTKPVVEAVLAEQHQSGKLSITIVGGGDGWIASYLLDHYADQVAHIRIVDIDRQVAEITQRFFKPAGVHNSFTDARVEWIFDDAGAWLRSQAAAQHHGHVDIVIIDCTDHTIQSSQVLYTPDFYADVHTLLRPHGGRVVQQMNTEDSEYDDFFAALAKQWKRAGLASLQQWSEYMPSFGGKSLFWMARKS